MEIIRRMGRYKMLLEYAMLSHILWTVEEKLSSLFFSLGVFFRMIVRKQKHIINIQF